MFGNMMSGQLLISGLIEHAEKTHPTSEIVSRRCEGDIHRYTMGEAAKRSKQLANALQKLGAKADDRIATLAWNNYRHFELYFGVSGMGAVLQPKPHFVNNPDLPMQIWHLGISLIDPRQLAIHPYFRYYQGWLVIFRLFLLTHSQFFAPILVQPHQHG